MADQLRYRHVGDRPLLLGERLVKPGDEFDYPEPIQSNGNFEPLSDAAKSHQATVDAEDAVRRKDHLASLGIVAEEHAEEAAAPEPPARRVKKTEPAADVAAAPQEA